MSNNIQLKGTENEEIARICRYLLHSTFIPRNKSDELKSMYDYLTSSKYRLEFERRLKDIGFRINYDDKREVVYISSEDRLSLETFKKITSVIGVLLHRHYIEELTKPTISENAIITVEKINELLLSYEMPTELSTIKDSLYLLEKYNLISLSCQYKKDFSLDTEICIYPSIMCWLDFSSENAKAFLEDCMKERNGSKKTFDEENNNEGDENE